MLSKSSEKLSELSQLGNPEPGTSKGLLDKSLEKSYHQTPDNVIKVKESKFSMDERRSLAFNHNDD